MPRLDWERVVEQLEGNAELIGQMVELFQADYPGELEQGRQAIATGDGPTLARAAHTLKGMVGTLGMRQAGRLTDELESRGKEGVLEEAPPRRRRNRAGACWWWTIPP